MCKLNNTFTYLMIQIFNYSNFPVLYLFKFLELTLFLQCFTDVTILLMDMLSFLSQLKHFSSFYVYCYCYMPCSVQIQTKVWFWFIFICFKECYTNKSIFLVYFDLVNFLKNCSGNNILTPVLSLIFWLFYSLYLLWFPD